MREQREIQNHVAVWSLRAVLRSKSFRQHRKKRSVDEDILELVGLDRLIDVELSKSELKTELTTRLQKIEGSVSSRSGRFFQNIDELAETVGLSACEKELLLFSLIMEDEERLSDALSSIGDVGYRDFITHLSAILTIKPTLIEKALRQGGHLSASGLLKVEKGDSFSASNRLEPLEGLGCALREGDLDKGLSFYFHQSPKPRLKADDFGHLRKDLDIFVPLLEKALLKRIEGVNVLLYGPPGTGKTEMVRMIASKLSAKLYEVSSQKDDGEPSDEDLRFRSYQLCQRLFSRQGGVIILFDEVEDVFPAVDFNLFFPIRRSGHHKGWTNRLLESNPVPAIWIANTIDQMDPAFIRRFDMVMEVPVPPKPVRKRMLGRMLNGIPVGSEWLNRIADHEHLAPSHIEKAARVAKLVGVADQGRGEEVLQQIIMGAHKAMGFAQKSGYRHYQCCHYGIEFINSDFDLSSLISGLKNDKACRICLYGPSGSGKTAFVHYLGEQLGRPVLLKRASDLLSAYLGETEKSIASMFDEARKEEAILLLDEADSFLQSRNRARNSWEITLVNELLVQMESFEGIFFCATNLMGILDGAVFRRFDLKVKFDYLSPDQAVSLFVAILEEVGIELSEDEKTELKSKLSSIGGITPGDFATVKRKLSFMNMSINAEILLDTLKEETLLKMPKRQSGFIDQ